MSNFDLSLTGAQINAALNKVHNPDTTPQNGSQNMVTSDGVFDAVNDIQFDNLNNTLVKTDISSGTNNTTLASSAAVKTYVDDNVNSFGSGYTLLSTANSTTGTASASGFLIIGFTANHTTYDAQLGMTIGGTVFPNYKNRYRNSNVVTIPIAAGESYDINVSYGNTVRVYFKAFS